MPYDMEAEMKRRAKKSHKKGSMGKGMDKKSAGMDEKTEDEMRKHARAMMK